MLNAGQKEKEFLTLLEKFKIKHMNETLGTTTISWKPTVEARKKPMSAVMQLINFILVERRQDDGSIKFHAHEDFSRFLQIEKENLKNAHIDGQSLIDYKNEYAEAFYNETYNETY